MLGLRFVTAARGQVRSFAKKNARYTNVNALVWKDGSNAADSLKFGAGLGQLKTLGAENDAKKSVDVTIPKTIKDSWRSKLAEALFCMGARANKHDAIKNEFNAVLAGVHSSEQVANYFRFQVNANSRSQAMQGVLAQANVSPVLIVVAAKALKSGYLRDLEQVYDHYLELLAAGTKELKGTVYSADKLDDSEMSSVRAAIMKGMVKAGSNLVLNNVVEPSTLGGIRVLVGSTYADLSLRKRLSALTAKQKNDEGDVVPLVAPGGDAPTIWKIAAEDVAAKK